MSKTLQDLKAAFAGESQANRVTRLCQASRERGYPQIARFWQSHPLKPSPTTTSASWVAGSTAQFTASQAELRSRTMYPEFIADAGGSEKRR
jgi:hypothetical protein